MKRIQKYEKFLENRKIDEPMNEEFIGGLLAAAKGALKNFLGNITAPFKSLKDDFKKGMKVEELKKKMSTTIETILKSATDNINKAEDENAINQIKDAFRKEIDEKVVEFDKEIKAVKESVSVDGQLINEGVKETMIGARVAIGMLKDIVGKAKGEFDVKFAAAKDLAAKKGVAVAEVKKIADDFKKLINDDKAFKEAQEKYMKDNKIEGGSDVGEIKPGESVIYKRDKFNEEEWKKLTDEDKKKPTEGKMKELQDKEMIGIKKVKEVKGDEVSFEDADFKKKKEDILGKSEAKAEGQEDLVKKLGELKTKKPDDIKKVANFVSFLSDEKNKKEIDELEQSKFGAILRGE